MAITEALRRIADRGSALAMLRLELAGVELAQARAQFVRWIAMALAIAAFGLLAVGCLSALLVVVAGERYVVAVLGSLALAYAAAVLMLALRLRAEIEAAPALLEATLEELRKDREALTALRPPAPPAS